jgi:elongation factor G
MQNVEVAATRSFALIGHSADGKTSLGEALLHAAGAVPELGSGDAKSSHLDFAPEEKERHHTLSSSVFGFDFDGHHLTLVDTPGDPNFQADGQIALLALDGAILLVSAVDGVKVGTESMWRAAERAGVPVIAFVNGLDRERANFAAAVESLRGLGASPVPIALPLGEGPKLRGVIDLIARRALVDGKEVEIPAEAAGAADGARARLVEAVAETDDTLLEHYLEAGELADDEVVRGLVAATHARKLVPVLAGASASEVGTLLALESAIRLLPSPLERGPRPATALAGGDVEAPPSPTAPFAAQVFKTVADRYAGTLSLLRVVSGTLRPDSSLTNATRGSKERVGKLLLMRGAEHVDVPEAGPGDVIALAKLKDVHTGDALTQDKGGVALAPLPIPVGVLSYAVSAKAKADEDKLFTALGRLAHEDPTLQISRDPSTGEFLLTGMGELHIRVAVQRLRRLYEVDIELKTPKVPYRETVTRKAENVEGKLKKQTGGKGMFGVCYLSVEPLPRGAGLEFVDEIVGGAIPRNLIPAVEKGVIESAQSGPLAGFPVVDVRVRCIDGKFHSVDSNEMAFKLAGAFGFKAAVEQARPTLLEPIMKAEITVPDDSLGDVMGDISSRRGRVQGTESRGHAQVVKAEVPMAEMLEYANALTSLTGGKGAFHMEFSHYDEVPAFARDKIIAEAKAAASREG